MGVLALTRRNILTEPLQIDHACIAVGMLDGYNGRVMDSVNVRWYDLAGIRTIWQNLARLGKTLFDLIRFGKTWYDLARFRTKW